MPAKSESQQRLFGMVHAYHTGKLKNPPKKVKEIADNISEESAEHFARTKRKGLPERKNTEKEASFLRSVWTRGFLDGIRAHRLDGIQAHRTDPR